MKRLALLLRVVTAAPLLSGYTLLSSPNRKWTNDSLPIQYFVGDQPPFGITNEEARELLVDSYANWGNVECSPLTAEHAGTSRTSPRSTTAAR